MNSLLYMWIHSNHSLIQIRIILDQHLRIERHGYKERAHAALDRYQKDVCDLQADEERECHDDGCEGATRVVGG